MRAIVTICTVLFISGCSGVYSPVPVGETPADIAAEQDEWEGTWIADDGDAILVTVIDGTNGILKVDWVEKNNEDTVERTTAALYLRNSGDWTFASVLEDDDDKEPYIWGRIIRTKRQAVLWTPDTKQFKALVEEGVLPGEIDGDSVLLGTLSSNHMEWIMSESNAYLFEWDDPLVLRKSGK